MPKNVENFEIRTLGRDDYAQAAETSDTVCLGVGLHSGYGAAQRMYVLRGYVPDGSGVWYEGRVWD